MKKIILLILTLEIMFFSSCSQKDISKKIENNKSLEPIEVVKLFIKSLGNRDFETAYNLEANKAWGDYQQFSSPKAFGGINATAINKIEEIEINAEDAKIYVDAYYYDPVNGNNRFHQYFYLKKINDEWKIIKLKILASTNKNPEEQINEILSKYKFFDDNVDQNKNKNTIYSYNLPNTDKLYIVFTTNEDLWGHFCYSYMSVFVFNEENKIKQKFIKAIKINSNFGSYAPEKENVNIYTFDDKFFILIDWGYTQMGITESFKTIYYIKNNRLQNIGEIETSFDNTGMYTWDDKEVEQWNTVNFEFVNSNSSNLPDISMLIERDSYNDPGQNYYVNYYFDGTKYVKK